MSQNKLYKQLKNFTFDRSFLQIEHSLQLFKNKYLIFCALQILEKSNFNFVLYNLFLWIKISLIKITNFNHFLEISYTIKAEIFAAELNIKSDSKINKGIYVRN